MAWKDSINQEADRLRAEGWRTSGDCARTLGINRVYVPVVLGEPGKVLRRGGKSVKLWRVEHVQAVARDR